MFWATRATGHRLNIGTKEELEVTGYTSDKVKFGLTVAATVLSGGLLLLLLTWRPSIKLALTHRRCALKDAQTLLVRDIYDQLWEEEVVREGEQMHFINRKLKYVWDDAACTFVRLRTTEHTPTFSTFHNGAAGFTGNEAARRLHLFGENFMKIEVLSVWQLLVQQAVNPFYIFQAFTVVLWCVQEYFIYSACIVALSLISIFLMVWETRRQSRALRETVTSQSKVAVVRDGQRTVLSSCEVVPGDVVLVGADTGRLEVDAVLLQGTVITNEAMLTGESLPVTKVSVPMGSDALFCEEEHKHHLLYSGTQVLQVRGAEELRALVIYTGFYTARGELVRSILFPKPTDFHFYSDLMKMLSVFLLLGFAAMGWSIYKWIMFGSSWSTTLLFSLDLVTFVVPPVLPATITAINVMAQQRLKRQQVFCLSSNYISLSGSVDVVCFDKTGTLTEEDLSLAGVMKASGRDFSQPQENLTTLPPSEPLTKALATCHSLALIDGKLTGPPLDVKIFAGLGWNLQEPEAVVNPDYGTVAPVLVQPQALGDGDPQEHELAILKTFPFESREQRMTVVVKARKSSIMEVFIKGAPERVATLCKEETVPGLLEAAVGWYTRQGLRVLAVAGNTLDRHTLEQVQIMPREELEKASTFLGLVLLQNKLKPETAPVLATIHEAQLTSVMITGDNLQTAMCIARQSGLVPPGHQIIVVKAVMEASSAKAAQHLKVYYYDADTSRGFSGQKFIPVRNDNYTMATDGETFDLLASAQDKTVFYRLLHKGRIFARMKPDQKITVVETLQDLGHQVAMCGDGCNDCGALKAADAGISLSSAEASVAAPFTSRKESITCIPVLIQEGRAVLVSLFCTFKYNVTACFGALICVMWNFEVHAEPSDAQYVTMDLLLMTIPPLVMGCTGAAPYLTPKQPQQRILSFLPSASLFSFLGLQALVYWGMYTYLSMQPWFEPFTETEHAWPPTPNYENTTFMLICYYFLVIGSFVFSHAGPFLKPFFTNYALTAYMVLATTFCIFITFYTGSWCVDLLNFKVYPEAGFAGMLFFIMCICLVVSFTWERWFLYWGLEDYVLPLLSGLCGRKPLHAKIEKELQENKEWPVLSEAPYEPGVEMYDSDEKVFDDESLGAENYQSGDDDVGPFGRQLTRRHRFNATVVHVPKKSDSDSEAATTPSTLPAPHTFGEQEPLIAQDSDGYRDPWDSRPASEERDQKQRFNMSVRHQIMKGTGGGFRTFKGSIKRQAAVEEGDAQPYEVIPLSNYDDHPQEAIYSTISEVGPDDYKEPYAATGVPVQENRQETVENEVYRDSATAEKLSKQFLYDVPKPVKPVEQPYSPLPKDASQALPPPPPHTPTEDEAQQQFGDPSC